MVVLFSAPGPSGEPEPSKLGGAQFLHEAIPGINDYAEPDATITYRLEGDIDGYRQKVYGGDPRVPFVSMQNLHDGMEQPAWNLVRSYEKLWQLLCSTKVNVAHVNAEWVQAMKDAGHFKLMISSIPAPALCSQGHQFGVQKVRIANECIMENLPDNTVMYSGDKDRSWYRCSRLFGVGGTEWADTVPTPPGADLVTAQKPLKTNCTCWAEDVVRVGRFGTWTKGILVNDAMRQTNEALDAL